jgi:hypothetical protein
MQVYHWLPVLECSSELAREKGLVERGTLPLLSLEEESPYLAETPDSDLAGPLKHQRKRLLIEEVMQHDLSERATMSALERMGALASHETSVRELIQKLDYQWRGEEWVFRGHVTSSGMHVYTV